VTALRQHCEGVAVGLLRTVTDAGVLVGPPVMGVLADAIHLTRSFAFAALLMCSCWVGGATERPLHGSDHERSHERCGPQVLWDHSTAVIAGLWTCRVSSSPSLTPDVQRRASRLPGSAAFKTARQGLGQPTPEWRGIESTSEWYEEGGTNDVEGNSEQAITSRCRRDGRPSGSVRTVKLALWWPSSGQRTV
jgi:hypothetical protein